MYLAKGGKQNKRDTGLIGVPDDEIRRRARDKSLSPEERQRYVQEEKARKWRNQQKRNNFQVDPDQVEAVVVTGVALYVGYRVVRFLPSLIPALWWTIPINAAAP